MGSRGSAEKSPRAAGRPRARPLSRQNKRFLSKSGAGFSGQKNILRPIFCLCTTIMITNHWAREGVRGLQNSAGRGCVSRGKHTKLGNRGGRGYTDGTNKRHSSASFLPMHCTREMMHVKRKPAPDTTVWRSPWRSQQLEGRMVQTAISTNNFRRKKNVRADFRAPP